MSTDDQDVDDVLEEIGPDQFTGPSRYWDAAETWFDMRLTPEQREIHEAVAENKYTLVEGANSFGKTFAIVSLSLAFRARHYPSSVVVTSGTYGKLKRTFCADAEDIHRQSGLFGEWKWSPNPHIDVPGEPTWQFEVHSPKDPEELEGVHNEYTLVIVDEADKEEVDATVIDAMESLISDDRDRMVVIANPPRDETNVVYELREDYHHLSYSSFDSHNVQIATGEREGEEVPGLATISKLKRDWEKYNGRDWPGLEQARRAHEQEGHNLDQRWLRRRAGVMPTDDATKHRPFYVDDVETALQENTVPQTPANAIAVGVDVARKGGDETVVCTLYGGTATFRSWHHTDHQQNERLIQEHLDGLETRVPIAIDATGEGSGVADAIKQSHGAARFKNNEKAVDEDEWDNKWTEALHHLGQRLPQLGLDVDRTTREDLYTAARVVEFEVRGLRSGDVVRATSKEEIKEDLGRSPDHLDAVAMACWAADADGGSKDVTRRRSGRDTSGRRRITR